MIDYNGIISKNRTRLSRLNAPYDPVTGAGSFIERKKVVIRDGEKESTWYLPLPMMELSLVKKLASGMSVQEVIEDEKGLITPELEDAFREELTRVRFVHDFEFWCIKSVKIYHKLLRKIVPFTLNRAQRRLLVELEKLRLAGVPIRIILVKSRQWGGSTLIQVYMAWIQAILTTGRNSFIVAMDDNQSRNIRGMYTRLAKFYPKVVGKITFKPFEGSNKNRVFVERDCIVGVGSVNNPDAFRSFDPSLVHLSEVGLWKETPASTPEDLVQSIASAVPSQPYTMIVKESTAKGVGNYFHREYLSAKRGESGYTPVFVPWHEIEMYVSPIKNYSEFMRGMTEYEWSQWEKGATLEGINWYRHFQKSEGYDNWRMQAEFPTDDVEAFQSTGRKVFHPLYVQRARRFNKKPIFKGDIYALAMHGKKALEGIEMLATPGAPLSVWAYPDKSIKVSDRYCVSLDIGGRTKDADFSVIRVFDRYWMMEGGVPEAILTWKGHMDQDIVIWKAVQIAKLYDNALFIPESNSIDSDTEGTEGDHFLTVLDEIVDYYPNIYCRTTPEKIRQGAPAMYGFHTNKKTKVMIVDGLNKAYRENGYIENDSTVLDEADTYEVKENGTYGAVEGCHDDEVMSTAINLWACLSYMPLPKIVTGTGKSLSRSVVSEASM